MAHIVKVYIWTSTPRSRQRLTFENTSINANTTGVVKLWRGHLAPCRAMWQGYQSCGEVTQPSVARLLNLWRDHLWRGYLVARLQSGYR